MTTESKLDIRDPGLGSLLAAALVALAVGLLVVVVAAFLGGRPESLGAAIGAAMVLTVLATGSFVVHVVARAMPPASLLVALLTYALQIAVLGAVLLSLQRSGALGDTVHAEWLATGLVAVTLTWVVAQIWASTRARVLLYDLPASSPVHKEVEAG